MKRFVRIVGLVSSLLFIFSILGCSSDTNSSKQAEKKEKPVAASASKPVKNAEPKVTDTTQNTNKNKAITESKVSSQPATHPNNNSSKETAKVSTEKPVTTNKNTTTTTAAARPAQSTKTSLTTSKTITATKPSTTTKQTTTTTKPSTKNPVPETTVTLSIVGPKDRGTILGASSVSIKTGDTIYDCIIQAAKKHNIVVDAKGSGSATYIEGIDNIYEFDYGAKSGWIFKLNGASITRSVGVIKVKDGDRIECSYTQ